MMSELEMEDCGCDPWEKGLRYVEDGDYYICKACGGKVSTKKVDEHYP